MKCQKCGINEVSFHYSSNINGNVTEYHLCPECAGEMGYSIEKVINRAGLFDGIMEGMFRPQISRRIGYVEPIGMQIPVMFAIPRQMGILMHDGITEKDTPNIPKQETAVDRTMQKRREENELREQMHEAARREDYETAARIRDQLQKMGKKDE